MAEISGAKEFVSKLRTGAIAATTAAIVLAPSFAANAQQATKVAVGGNSGYSAIELQDAKRITGDTDCATFRFSRPRQAGDTGICEVFRGQALQRDIKATDRDIKAIDRDIACMATIKSALTRKDSPVTRDIIIQYGKDRVCDLVRDFKLSELTPQGSLRPQL